MGLMPMSRDSVANAYEKYGHLVLKRCELILRDTDAAKDALQEVFIRLMKYGQRFAQAESPVRWLYRVSDRVCFDAIERRARQPALLHPQTPELATPADLGEDVANRQVILRFLNIFDDTLKRIAVLHYVDELSQERIAEEMGWSRQTINKKIALLRRRAKGLGHSLGGVS